MKIKKLLIAAICTLSVPFSCFAEGNQISVYLNGAEADKLMEYDAVIVKNRVLISVRDLCTLTSTNLTWDKTSNSAVMSNSDETLSFSLGNKEILVKQDGTETKKVMDIEPVVLNERMYLPVRFAAELMGMEVKWDNEAKRLDLVSESVPNDESKTDGEEQKIEENLDEKGESSGETSKIREIQITEQVHYSYEDENIDEIVSYIKRNIDEDFDVSKFQVKTNISNASTKDGIVSTAISMDLKKGDFVTKDGYFIGVKNGLADVILISGNPDCTQSNASQEIEEVDEEWLKEMARKEITLTDGYKIVEQRVLKKYDTEPYYAVVTNIYCQEYNLGYVEYFEYRVNKNKMN